MMRWILLVALFVAAPLPSKQITLRIPLQPGEEIVVVTFDEHRVSTADVKRWMFLHENAYNATPKVGYYGDCKTGDAHRLEQDIKKTEQVIENLNPNVYPQELYDVVQYLRNLQSFWLWQGQQELEFLKSGKLPDSEYNGVGLGMCQVHNSEDKQRMCHELFHRWHNCVVNTVGKQLGGYPKEKWKAFLDSFGMQEKIESTVD
jgi:hypothetical protein